MKKFFAICVVLIMSNVLTENIVANRIYLTINLHMLTTKSRIYDDDDNRGNRFVALTCTIGEENGVEISGTTDEIIAYEIWDATGSVCIGYFTDEEEFVEYLFSLNGDFRIILFYSDCILTGEVSLK